jgi:SAM-dependent methyltransferase
MQAFHATDAGTESEAPRAPGPRSTNPESASSADGLGPPPRRSDPADAACAYWADRADHTSGAAAVLPSGRWLRYHAFTHRLLQRFTLGRLDRPRYRRAVDLGCGRGEWTALFAPRVDEMFACDVAAPFVAETRARLDALHHTSWNVERSDLRGYQIPEGLDLAYLGGILTYLTDAGADRHRSW